MASIDLTDEEAQAFMLFRKHQSLFELFDEVGVFNVRNGRAILNFDSNGTLVDIECQMKLYKRGIDVVPILIQLHHGNDTV